MPRQRAVKLEPAAPAVSYQPYSANTTAVIEIGRPKCASVFCNVFKELNQEGHVVFSSHVHGHFTIAPGALVKGAIRVEEEHPRATTPPTRRTLELDLGSGVDLMDLAHFTAALKALVDELFAQGANDNAWNSHGAGVGDATLVAALDSRVPVAPLAAAS